jgi:predicted DNA-binding protein with PD1-like motif
MKGVPLRLQPGDDLRQALEILSFSGTLSADGVHLHIAIADSSGAVIGGHLCPGSLVRTTAELVIGLLPEWHFRRERDPATGHPELAIKVQPER